MNAPEYFSHEEKAHPFPMNRWWIAGFSWELKDQPLARKILGHAIVFFRTPNGQLAALEDRCCHKELPLSMGSIENTGLRCGYHGLLYNHAGQCIEIPGQSVIPSKACVRTYPFLERDQILWIWIGESPAHQPLDEPPAYPFHRDPAFEFGGECYHYDAPYQLIHENLMDLSHLGYVHTKTIGGNPSVHMNARLNVSQDGDVVRVVRLMPGSQPPPTYTAAWPFKGLVDRWQEVEFHVSHVLVWSGAMDEGSGSFDDSNRVGFHMRGLHGVTPESESTTHYFWTIANNPQPGQSNVTQLVIDQTAATFLEDKWVIEAQWKNQQQFQERTTLNIHVDGGPNRARRVIERLSQKTTASALA
jgi:vanillate O-demethylase monooxygenase subunit